MSVKLPCGCKDIVMCKTHEAAWWARHDEALKRQATDNTSSGPIRRNVRPYREEESRVMQETPRPEEDPEVEDGAEKPDEPDNQPESNEANMQTNVETRKKERVRKPPRVRASRAKKATAVANGSNGVKRTKPSRVEPSKKKEGKTSRVRLDFEGKVLPFIVSEFKKLDDPNDPPRGWGKAMYQKIADKFGCTTGAGDQYFWKAKWHYAKELGLKKK